MWSKLKPPVSHEKIDRMLDRAKAVVANTDRTEIVESGKEFFGGEPAGTGNFDFLKQIHLDVWPAISNQFDFKMPVIDHSLLLIKKSGGAGTKMHQDRAYWLRREAVPSIFSVWIALDDIVEANGSLLLSRNNEVSPDDLSTFNTGQLLAHEEVPESDGIFPLLIPKKIASGLAESMQPIEMAKGDAIAFDSIEPHMSSANTAATPRLAMKIAYAEGEGKTHFLTQVDELEDRY